MKVKQTFVVVSTLIQYKLTSVKLCVIITVNDFKVSYLWTFRVQNTDQGSADTKRLQTRVLNHARSLSLSLTVAYSGGRACTCPPPSADPNFL